MIRSLQIALVAGALSCWSTAWAQPGVWLEIGDAPEGVPDRQVTAGTGALTEIRGSLDRPNGDHVDTYCIVIDDPAAFYASTSSHLGGSFTRPAELLNNTRMWLWSTSTSQDMAADIQLASDDDAFAPQELGSTISDPSTFTVLTMGMIDPTAAGINLVPGGTYLISISTFDNDPEDDSGVDLVAFDPARPTDLYGPNPVAGPFGQWENEPSPDFGSYVMALQGARFCTVPEPAITVLGVWIIAFVGPRRRSSADGSRRSRHCHS